MIEKKELWETFFAKEKPTGALSPDVEITSTGDSLVTGEESVDIESYSKNIKERIEEFDEKEVFIFKLSKETASAEVINEIGLSVVEAALDGKKVVVSIDSDYESSLQDPYSKSQFATFFSMLKAIQSDHPGLISFDGSSTSSDSSEPIYQQLSEEDLSLPENPWVVVTGSGATDIKSLAHQFKEDRKDVLYSIEAAMPSSRMSVLTEGSQAEAWDNAFEESDPEVQSKMFNSLSLSELDHKVKADVLVVPIHDESSTIGGTSEIAWFIFNALKTGQHLNIMLEPFNKEFFMVEKIKDAFRSAQDSDGTDKASAFLEEIGLSEDVIAGDDEQSFVILNKIVEGQRVSWDEISNSSLKDSKIFKRTINSYNVRETTNIWVERLLEKAQQDGINHNIKVNSNLDDFVNDLPYSDSEEADSLSEVEKESSSVEVNLKSITKEVATILGTSPESISVTTDHQDRLSIYFDQSGSQKLLMQLDPLDAVAGNHIYMLDKWHLQRAMEKRTTELKAMERRIAQLKAMEDDIYIPPKPSIATSSYGG